MKTDLNAYSADGYVPHPLEGVEDVLTQNNWVFKRSRHDEIVLKLKGKSCDYHMFFIWQDCIQALQLCCQFDVDLSDASESEISKTLRHLNEGLWVGHFDVSAKIAKPVFRHTILMRGLDGFGVQNVIEDSVDIAISQCEKHFSVFDLLGSETLSQDKLDFALMDTVGES